MIPRNKQKSNPPIDKQSNFDEIFGELENQIKQEREKCRDKKNNNVVKKTKPMVIEEPIEEPMPKKIMKESTSEPNAKKILKPTGFTYYDLLTEKDIFMELNDD